MSDPPELRRWLEHYEECMICDENEEGVGRWTYCDEGRRLLENWREGGG